MFYFARCITSYLTRCASAQLVTYDGTRSQGISQFYLHALLTSNNRMNHTCLCLPKFLAEAGTH